MGFDGVSQMSVPAFFSGPQCMLHRYICCVLLRCEWEFKRLPRRTVR